MGCWRLFYGQATKWDDIRSLEGVMFYSAIPLIMHTAHVCYGNTCNEDLHPVMEIVLSHTIRGRKNIWTHFESPRRRVSEKKDHFLFVYTVLRGDSIVAPAAM